MIAATFHGASYSPPNYDFDTIEVFDSLEDAVEALFERYTMGDRRQIESTYLDGHKTEVYWPGVEVGDSFTVYRMVDPSDDGEEALEEVRLDVHTAVHGGWNDYILTLATGTRGDVVVEVAKAGI